ncbi:MAG: hypothetical protein Q9207_005733 [Kuettlingeria erythrocarpa]
MPRCSSEFRRARRENLGKWPGIPPGPYFDTHKDPQPTVTKDMAYAIRQHIRPANSKFGQYIYSRCEPLHFFPKPDENFGVYLFAAIAKHHSIKLCLPAAEILRVADYCDYASEGGSCDTVCAFLYDTLRKCEDIGVELTDRGKMEIIVLEEQLTEVAFTAYPSLLEATYDMNTSAVVNTQLDLAAVSALAAVSTTLEDLEHRLLRVRNAYIYLLRNFNDISTLPDHFWARLQSTYDIMARNWGWQWRSVEWTVKYAESLTAKMQDTIEKKKLRKSIIGFVTDRYRRRVRELSCEDKIELMLAAAPVGE